MILSILLIIYTASQPIIANHIRSATISWRPVSTDGYNHTIEFYPVITFRKSRVECAWAYVQAELSFIFDPPILWQIKNNGTRVSWFNHRMTCTEIDKLDGWSFWQGYQLYNFTSDKTTFNISYGAEGWTWGIINKNDTFPYPELRLLGQNIDFNLRSDTGDFNHPPVANYPSLVFVEASCPESFTIQVRDDDGDRVRCRYAKTPEECGSVCSHYPYFELNETSCTISYNGSISSFRDSLVAVALVIEDYPKSNISIGTRNVTTADFISAIPFQFLVNVRRLKNSCKKAVALKPRFGRYKCIRQSEGFKEIVTGIPSTKEIRFVHMFLFGPMGLQREYVNLLPPTNRIEVELRWKPKEHQIGKHSVCYHFRDVIRYPAKFGAISNVQCFTLEVIADPLCKINGYDVAPLNGSVKCGCNAPSYTCTYSCHPGYRLHGPERATCFANSSIWDKEKLPVCKRCDLPAWYLENIMSWFGNSTNNLDPAFRLLVKGPTTNSTYQRGLSQRIVLRVIRPHRNGHFRGFVLTATPGECGTGTFRSLGKVEYFPECNVAFQDGQTDLQRSDIARWSPPGCGCVTLKVMVRFFEIPDGSAANRKSEPKFKRLTKTICARQS